MTLSLIPAGSRRRITLGVTTLCTDGQPASAQPRGCDVARKLDRTEGPERTRHRPAEAVRQTGAATSAMTQTSTASPRRCVSGAVGGRLLIKSVPLIRPIDSRGHPVGRPGFMAASCGGHASTCEPGLCRESGSRACRLRRGARIG